MADIVKLRTGYAISVALIRTGFSGPPGAGGGSAYDDTAILARVAAVEQSIAALPTPYDYAALADRVSALEGASVAWVDIMGKPADFPPTAHRHDASQIDNLPAPAWADITGKPAAFPPVAHSHEISAVTGLQAELDGKSPTGHSHPWSDLTGVPTEFPPSAHQHTIGDVSGLQAALDDKAPASSIWTQEQLQDLVAAMFQTGTHSNASITYDDASGSLSITASGGGASLTEEEVEDFVGGLIVQGTGISVAYDDAGNVLSISLAGESYTTAEKNKLAGIAPAATANATDGQLRDRSTHTGTQAITTISGLQGALDGKAPTNHSHAISDVAGLQTALTTATDTLATLQAEIAEARAHLSAVSAFAAPNAGGIVPGRYYDNATTSVTNSNYTSAVDRVDMTPFITSRPLRVDQIGFAVATAGSAAYGRAFVYEAGADGWPSDLLFEGDDLDLNSANFRGHTLASPITFEANRVYWVGWRFGAATTYAVMRGLNISSAPNLGLAASSSNNYLSVLRRTIPFATRLPATWGFVGSDIAASVPPSIRMRATV